MDTIRKSSLSACANAVFTASGNESADEEGLQTAMIQLGLEEAPRGNSTKLEEDKTTGAVKTKTGIHYTSFSFSSSLLSPLAPRFVNTRV